MDNRRIELALGRIQALLPSPFSLEEFRLRVQDFRGRPLVVRPLVELAELAAAVTGAAALRIPQAVCGLWIRRGGTDYVFYTGETVYHRRHSALHEIAGHVLMDHVTPQQARFAELHAKDPGLSETLFLRMVGGDALFRAADYGDAQEAEAEVMATRVGELIAGRDEGRRHAGSLGGLGDLLGGRAPLGR